MDESFFDVDVYVSKLILIGAKPAPMELAQARLKACNECEFKEVRKLTPLSKEKAACGVCKCPLDKKTATLTNRKHQNLFLPLKRTKCPHPKGSKWELLDKQMLGESRVKQLDEL